MQKTTRRNLLKAAAVGGVTATGLSAAFASTQKPDPNEKGHDQHGHNGRPRNDKGAFVVASFGQWDVDPANPLDRQPIGNDLENRTRNVHLMLPYRVEIEEGGAVSFLISGLHQILIYGPNRTLEEVQAGAMGSKPLPGVPPLVDYDVARVYRGVDPRVLHYAPIVPQPPETTGNLAIDRVETVVFKERGRYLVICGVLPHFNEGMHGYVRVTS